MRKDRGLGSISVMSFGHTRYIITAIHEVIECLKLKGIEVNHIGISPDSWYCPEALHSAQAYRFFNYDFKLLPRISGAKDPYWSTPNVSAELSRSLHSMVDFMDDLISQFEPDVFFIGDDCGPLEVFAMEYLNWRTIPIVFNEHGPAVFNVKLKGNHRIRDKIHQDWKHRDYHLPWVNPSGLNADYLICSYSEATKNMMIKLGVRPSLIRGTGFPYFDRVYSEKGNSVKKKNDTKKRILINSNGRGTFGGLYQKSAINAYSFLINITQILENDYDIYLRLKPGETIESFLEPGVVQQLNDLKIRYDDNTLDSYKAIQKYDLVIGEMSTVLLECLILNIPTILVSLDDDPLHGKQYDNQHFVQHVIGVLTISDASEIKKLVKMALSDEYLMLCSERLNKNTDYFYHIDGRISERVARVIIEAIVRSLIAKKQFTHAYSVVVDGNRKFPSSAELLILEARLNLQSENIRLLPKVHDNYLGQNSKKTRAALNPLAKEFKVESASYGLNLAVQKQPDSYELPKTRSERKICIDKSQDVKQHGTPKASIIIPTYNRERFLSAAVQSFVKQEFPASQYEILIVDNGSTDNTKNVSDTAKSHCRAHDIKYLFEPEPGLLSARHRGALEAKGEILIFVDDDIEATPHWLSAIIDGFKDESIHLVGGPSLPKFEIDPPDWISKYWTMKGNRIICGSLSLFNPGDEEFKIDPTYVWGLNFSIRKKSFFNSGGFHPDCVPKELQYFQGDGETGLSLKLRAKGLKAVYIPAAKVYHHISRERLTAAYFESRFFYQGVCDSFTKIRQNRGLSNISIPQYQTANKNMSGVYAFEQYRQSIHDRIQKAYVDGFIFHQDAVKKNRPLLKWVLKENYFDYKLPSLKDYQAGQIENQSPFNHCSSKGKSIKINGTNNSTIKNQLKTIRQSPFFERQSTYDHTMAPLVHQDYFRGLKDQLISLDIAVDEEDIDLTDFEKWLQTNPEIKKFYLSYGDVIIEKCLEHYLTYRHLKVDQKDVYIDIAAAGSPWVEILSKRKIRSFRLDKAYAPGINGVNIGADACDTKLSESFCSVLTLHCAYECFMGDADTKFLKEAGRILSNNGRLAIVPLYLEDKFFIVTSPFCNQKDVLIDKGARRVWRDDKYTVPFSRHYSPESFFDRVYANVPGDMTAKVIFFKNLEEVMRKYSGQRIYCFFLFYATKLP